ncbi:hypothetical protein EXS74_00165 [Candidatus Woesearchaeota archaeon]|nr:hypothetical protein [Candidatus Woesearchaeota archaeon]
MNFIRKIAEGKSDEWTKRQFTRYGMGTYEQKALLQISKGKKGGKISSSFEFAPDFAYALAESVKNKVQVTGGIITKQKLTEEDAGFPFAGMKQFAGVKTYLIDTDLTKAQIQGLFGKYSSGLVLLSFKTDMGELKTKVKSPKSTKAKIEGENAELPKADFCSFKTTDMKILEDYAFDVAKDFTKVFIMHSFVIESLEIPKQYEKDFVLARLHALRKGKLIREIHLGEKKIGKEYTLSV